MGEVAQLELASGPRCADPDTVVWHTNQPPSHRHTSVSFQIALFCPIF